MHKAWEVKNRDRFKKFSEPWCDKKADPKIKEEEVTKNHVFKLSITEDHICRFPYLSTLIL